MYLHYLATGYETNEERVPALNLVLCGLKPDDTVTETITVTDSEKELIRRASKSCDKLLGIYSTVFDSRVSGELAYS